MRLKRLVYKFNRTKLVYCFSDNFNKNIVDELNRSFNSLFFFFDDNFNGNLMNSELDKIVKENILVGKENEESLIYKKIVNFSLNQVFCI